MLTIFQTIKRKKLLLLTNKKPENKYSLVFLKFLNSEYYLSQNGVKSFLAKHCAAVKAGTFLLFAAISEVGYISL